MAWQEQLEALGLNDSNMPNMIKKAIKDLFDFQSTLERIEQTLERDDLSEKKREELEEQAEVLEESIEQQEAIVEKKIAQWDKNKEGYEARAQKLKAAAQARKGGKVATQADPTPTPPAPPTPPTPPVEVITDPQGSDEPKGEEPKKKGGGFGWVALGLVVAVLTAGAVIINKDE